MSIREDKPIRLVSHPQKANMFRLEYESTFNNGWIPICDMSEDDMNKIIRDMNLIKHESIHLDVRPEPEVDKEAIQKELAPIEFMQEMEKIAKEMVSNPCDEIILDTGGEWEASKPYDKDETVYVDGKMGRFTPARDPSAPEDTNEEGEPVENLWGDVLDEMINKPSCIVIGGKPG